MVLGARKVNKEHQIDFAEQELKQVKSEIRIDKLKSVATDVATALASGVSSLFGSGKMKSLERKTRIYGMKSQYEMRPLSNCNPTSSKCR